MGGGGEVGDERRLDNRARRSVVNELNCLPEKRGGGETSGNGGESEGTPVNIVNKALFRYTGLQYALLLVDYDTFCEHSSRERVDICYQFTQTLKLLKSMQSNISCMWSLFVMSRKFALILFSVARTFTRFFQRALGDLDF